MILWTAVSELSGERERERERQNLNENSICKTTKLRYVLIENSPFMGENNTDIKKKKSIEQFKKSTEIKLNLKEIKQRKSEKELVSKP